MRSRILLLAPVLASIAGCSQKIEAQEIDSEPIEVEMWSEREDKAATPSKEQEADRKLHWPAGLD